MANLAKKRVTIFTVAMLLVAAVILGGALKNQTTSALTDPPICTLPYTVYPSTTSATTITGNVNTVLNTTVVPPSPIVSVIFNVTNQANNTQYFLGKGLPTGTTASTSYWSMPWVTAVTPNGNYKVTATIKDSMGFVCKAEAANPVLVNNPTLMTLFAQPLTPPSATLSTNTNLDFNIPTPVMAGTVDVSQYAVYEWATTIGAVTPNANGNISRFFAGPTAGAGQVKVAIRYGGSVIYKVSPVQVISPTTQTSTTSPTGTTNNNQQPTSPTSTTGTPTNPATSSTQPTLTTQLLAADTTVKDCLLKNIGEARLKALETEQTRPTAEEFDKYRNCFAKTSFVVASTLAPIPPSDVKNLKDTKDVTVGGAANEKANVNGTETKTLVFKGSGKPNSTVLLYIFSEPIVLATTTGSDGTWSYTLEDPLAPGEHEVYATVSSGDGTYQRSSPFSFIIGKAEASDSNPNGYSLELGVAPTATQNNRSINVFIVGIGGAILLALAVLTVFIKIRTKKQPAAETAGFSTSEVTAAPVTPVAPVEHPAQPTDTPQINQTPTSDASAEAEQPQPTETDQQTQPTPTDTKTEV